MDAQLSLEEKSIRRAFHVLCLGVLFVVLAQATHIAAYPKMLEAFELGPGYSVWMQLGFALGLTGFQPFFGWVGDSYSQKVVILIGSALLVIGAVLVAVAPFFWVLVVGLFIKGVAGSAVIPAGFTYAGKFFKNEKRGKALGIFGFYSVIGGVIGPLLSGTFVDSMGWSSIFWLCAALGVVTFVIFAAWIPVVKGDKPESFDFLGVVFVIFILLGLLSIPTFINNYGVSSMMWTPSLGLFALSFLILIWLERKRKEPLLDIEYAANRNFWVISIIAVLMFVTFSSVMYILTFFIQDIQGKSSTVVGLLQMPLFISMAIANLLCGRWMSKFSARSLIGASIAILVTGSGMLAFVNLNTSFLYLFFAMSFIGTGIGLVGPALRGVVLSKANAARMGVVTFTYTLIENASQRVGASFGLVAFALFAAGGNAVAAMSKTALALTIFSALAFLFLFLIPKKVTGFKKSDQATDTNVVGGKTI
ncbi:MFS transporter [Virgibacillus sp. MSP4-1]|uniref:MFS transporter n=1 Tax=Virgibacillus sp. MSP4-1 TaxID=2700081 RepID=UPI00039FF67A|nr:MFS transporter [Virgibacillus sp. MSP4-1]QHS23422.1 MFS transporter [Virgibacillus sp. MSP4-1]